MSGRWVDGASVYSQKPPETTFVVFLDSSVLELHHELECDHECGHEHDHAELLRQEMAKFCLRRLWFLE